MTARKQDSSPGAPMWMVTYSEFVTILLCFFVAWASMSDIKPDRFRQAVGSFRSAFGGAVAVPSGEPSESATGNRLVDRLLAVGRAEASEPASEGARSTNSEDDSASFHVASTSADLRISVGGARTFAVGSAVAEEATKAALTDVAALLAGGDTKLLVRGHADRGECTSESTFSDVRDLAYARAAAVADILERNGVPRNRMLVVVVGDAEPLVRQTDIEERRARNRRVEVVVTEDRASIAGAPEATREPQESPRGGRSSQANQ